MVIQQPQEKPKEQPQEKQKERQAEKQRNLQLLNLDQILDRQPLRVSPDTAIAAVFECMGVADSSLPLAPETIDSQYNGFDPVGRFSCALIVSEDRLLGIFTERDLVRLVAEDADLSTTPISAVMTQPVQVLKHSQIKNVFTVLACLKQNRIRQVPVVKDSGSLLGIVTKTTVRMAMQPFNFLKVRHVGDVMSAEVVTALPSENLTAIARRMHQRRVSCVVIIETECQSGQSLEKPIDIVTERDIVQFQSIGLPLPSTTVQDTIRGSRALAREIVCDSYYQQAQPYIKEALAGKEVHYELTIDRQLRRQSS